jgi:putative iron-only hydrogenase system regulator
MENRIGVIGIVVDEPTLSGEMVNHHISRSSSIIRGRMGLPGTRGDASVIALVVSGTTDEIGALTGRLGSIPGVRVKSALAAKKGE